MATDLRGDGVETILDQWHTDLGDQLSLFMEKEIRENDYVLIVCTPNYRLKSDGRMGGVGYEGDIMTAEVLTKRNHRKFIPVLARGIWDESAPTWLKGKIYVDLSTEFLYRRNYSDLTATLLGTRPTVPAILEPSESIQAKSPTRLPPDESVKIVGVIIDEVTEPILDGSPGSALYSVPFRLNRTPSLLWSEIFVRTWDQPPSFSTMHRPGSARVAGAKIILDGTTIEEVRKYHRDTLVLCVDVANKEEKEIITCERKRQEIRQQQVESHRKKVQDISEDLSFD